MKNIQKITALLLSIGMMPTLSGCGSSSVKEIPMSQIFSQENIKIWYVSDGNSKDSYVYFFVREDDGTWMCYNHGTSSIVTERITLGDIAMRK